MAPHIEIPPAGFTRRAVLRNTAALAGLAGLGVPAFGTERYQLGCMTSLYGKQPMRRALEGIRKGGYKSIGPGRTHADLAFTAALPVSGRAELKKLFEDHGLQPVLSLGGFGGELTRPEGFKTYLEELDLCAEFGIGVMVGGGPWYFQKWPNLPKRAKDWDQEVAAFYPALEKAVQHAEKVGVTIALKPHTGITATAKTCLDVVKRVVSDRLRICWDAGNVSFYEGIYPDPDLPDLAPHVNSVCIKDHKGGRGEPDFPVPGSGQIDHELMFGTLFAAGFNGPLVIERLEGRQAGRLPPEDIDERVVAAYQYLSGALGRTAPRG